MAQRAEKLSYWPGDTLVRAGQPGDGAYLLVSGPVERVAGLGASTPERVAPGMLIGEMAMLIEHNYAATFVARDRVFCLKFTRAAMHAYMCEDASVLEHFKRRITERMTRMSEDLRKIDRALAASAKTVVQPKPASQPRFVAAARAWR
jgi:CRP-like cAMP-binding protein